MEENFEFINKGWKCPKCGRMFSPSGYEEIC